MAAGPVVVPVAVALFACPHGPRPARQVVRRAVGVAAGRCCRDPFPSMWRKTTKLLRMPLSK